MMPQDDSGLAIDPDPSLEREAEDAAQQALADGPVVVNRKGLETHIQRAGKDWNHGPSVAEELYGDDEVDLEELGIDPDDSISTRTHSCSELPTGSKRGACGVCLPAQSPLRQRSQPAAVPLRLPAVPLQPRCW